jgi:hypothetical protein
MVTTIMALQGCAGLDPVRTHRDWSGKRDALRTILVTPAKIRMYAVLPGNHREEFSEWSSKASEYVTSSVIAQLQRSGGPSVSRITAGRVPAELVPQFMETQVRFEIVNARIVEELFEPSSTSSRKYGGGFDYSLGDSVSALTAGQPVDGLVMIWGLDNELATEIADPKRSTTPRFDAPPNVQVVQWGATYMSMAFVDARTGAVLWFRYLTNKEGTNYDLRSPISTTAIVKRLVTGFLADQPGGQP